MSGKIESKEPFVVKFRVRHIDCAQQLVDAFARCVGRPLDQCSFEVDEDMVSVRIDNPSDAFRLDREALVTSAGVGSFQPIFSRYGVSEMIVGDDEDVAKGFQPLTGFDRALR